MVRKRLSFFFRSPLVSITLRPLLLTPQTDALDTAPVLVRAVGSIANAVAAGIQLSMASDSSIYKACDSSTEQIRVIPMIHIFYMLDNYLYLNISLRDLPSISICRR